MIPYEDCKIYGPYSRKEDNRKHIIAIHSDGTRQTVSYSRYLVEKHLGKYLTPDEEVHHRDGNESNDDLSNLIPLPKILHKNMKRRGKYSNEKVICLYCNKEFILTISQVRDRAHNEKQGKLGPFCSRRCAGRYGQTKQMEYRKQ